MVTLHKREFYLNHHVSLEDGKKPQHGMLGKGLTGTKPDPAQVVSSSATDPHHTYLSISTPLLSQEVEQSYGFSPFTLKMIKEVCSDAVEIVEPPRQGYQLTLNLNFAKLPSGKDPEKVIQRITSVQAVILSSQLKEMLENVNSQDMSLGMYKPIKLLYHPREPFYVIRKQPQKITAIFPMRFNEPSDVIIATAFFQELMDVGGSKKWATAPPCCWSPIPPPELRGEPLEDLSTNGGFVSFGTPQTILHMNTHGMVKIILDSKELDKTVWSLLNFYAYVKNHVKCTRGFIQRRMQKCLKSLVEVLYKDNQEEDEDRKRVKAKTRCKYVRKLVRFPKADMLKKIYGAFTRKIKRIRSRIKIHRFKRLQRQWLTLPKISSPMGYAKLD